LDAGGAVCSRARIPRPTPSSIRQTNYSSIGTGQHQQLRHRHLQRDPDVRAKGYFKGTNPVTDRVTDTSSFASTAGGAINNFGIVAFYATPTAGSTIGI